LHLFWRLLLYIKSVAESWAHGDEDLSLRLRETAMAEARSFTLAAALAPRLRNLLAKSNAALLHCECAMTDYRPDRAAEI
jgi:hypothetical protein